MQRHVKRNVRTRRNDKQQCYSVLTDISHLSKYIVPWKTSYLNILNLSLLISNTFIVTFVVFTDVFLEKKNIFAILMDLFQTSFLAPCILNTPC